MIGLEDPNIIYIVDFCLCKKYRSSKTGKHIRLTSKKNLMELCDILLLMLLKG